MFTQWILFLHVLSAITFFLAHGASAATAFRIRKETDFNRMRAMLDLSAATFMAMLISFLVMGLSGLALPFLVKLWDKWWVWISIVLMVVVVVWMGLFNEKGFKHLRRLVGLPYMIGGKEFPAETPASAEEVAAHLKKINLHALTIIGYVIPAFVLWLMVFKPF
jgi:small-conductance mechanosensitive channel